MDDKDKMLIDAAHPEETRVVVLRGNRVEEFDFESAAKQPLRGNIYLAKVTRVEPSLQAAFVDYGGNRHGFLAFNEIHPDYYQIPVADRQLLLDEEAKQARAEVDDDDSDDDGDAAEPDGDAQFDDDDDDGTLEQGETPDSDSVDAAPSGDSELSSDSESSSGSAASTEDDTSGESKSEALLAAGDSVVRSAPVHLDDSDETDSGTAPDIGESASDAAPDAVGEAGHTETAEQVTAVSVDDSDNQASDENSTDEQNESGANDGAEVKARGRRRPARRSRTQDDDEVESVGSEDALEELPQRRQRHRTYKIQEVIRRHQIVLVQVVKEERGNKGAALTTYMSLAGRYTVLMPNTARGGGISRKITNATDRKRLRKIADELEVPEGMGLIIRTAGASRTKAEIKRDFEYLLRLWENVRELTLESTAPTLVYEEGDLIKRSIRDLYSKEIGEVLVAGEQGHKNAKDFMRMLTPSHAKNVKLYDESEPLFSRFQIERQLNAMYSPFVTLRSGGYIVINQTEALVSVDVNSGKSTREHSIEETALGTNLEASEEISRQLRLRDLAGLVVIDFIDMEERRNNRSVERRLKDCLKNDRARIQVGRISHFGLLEMSRQRLRTGMLEGSTSQCQHCQGTGVIRSTESVALSVLRAVEEALMSGEKSDLSAVTSVEAALYILNNKREYVQDIEERYEVGIRIVGDDTLHGANFTVERATDQSDKRQSKKSTVVQMDWSFQSPQAGGRDEDGNGKKRRRRRKRRDGGEAQDTAQPVEASEAANVDSEQPTVQTEDGGERRPRRRGKRGGRRNRRPASSDGVAEIAAEGAENGSTADAPSKSDQPEQADSETRADAPDEEKSATRPRRRQRRPRGGARRNGNGARESAQATEATGSRVSSNDDAQPATSRDDTGSAPIVTPPSTRPTASTAQPETVTAKPQPQPQQQDAVEASAPAPQRSSKRGWWQRRIGSG